MAASEILLNVVFYVLAAAAVGGAVAVATSRNIVRSAFALLAVLFAAAALYALMKADFIAAAQVLIYVGGILVLIIFAVMLTHRITDVKLSNDSTPGPAAFCACLCLLFSLVVVILFTAKWERKPEEVRIAGESEVFLSQYQKDGATGLARGGSTFEDAVVLAARVPKPIKRVEAAEFVATSVRDSEGKKRVLRDSSGKDMDNPIVYRKSVPYDADIMKVAFEKLEEGEWTWTVKLRGFDWESPAVGATSAKPEFLVYRGTTEPIARALAGPYLFAFEVVSVLLLAALVGAAFLARKEVREV
jgi:NADH:ubiquinone oxidoreductase subunit 6 (subunit J)